MAESDEINKVKKQLEDLKKSLDDASSKSIDRIIKSFIKGKASLEKWKEQLEYFRDIADSTSDILDSINKSLMDSVNELNQQNVYLRTARSIGSQIAKTAANTLSVRKGETSINEKSIKAAKEKIESQRRSLKLSQLNLGVFSKEGREIKSIIDKLNDYEKGLDGVLETNEKITKELGAMPKIAGGLDKALSKLGFPELGIKDAIDETRKLGQIAARNGEEFNSMSKFTSLVKNNIKEMVSPANLIQGGITLLVDALKSVDDGAGQLAKSMNMTYSEAIGTQQELTAMAASSFDVALNTKNLSETLMFVGKQLGSNAKLNEADLKTFTKLREQAGFTNEELYGIQQLSLVNNKSLEKNTEEILGGAKAYASRNKLVINEKDILREVSKASATIKLSLGGSAEAVAEAAVQAKQFGLNLEQADKIAQSLLQFESSIESELSAELLLGKDLNFEKARQLSLNNDIAGAAEEIAKQVGTSADFANMNAIQQEAIAKAAGLTKDELAQSLMDREALQKLSAKEGESAQEAFNRLVEEVGIEKAKKQLGNEQLANQFEQQSVQERLVQIVEKLKEIFVSLAEPILAIISPLMDLVGTILPAINFLLQPIVWAFKTIGDAVTGFTDLMKGDLHDGLDGFLQIAQSIAVVWGGIALTAKLIGKETIKNISLQGIFSNLLKKDFWISIGSSIAKMWGTIVGMLGPFGIPVAIAAGAGLVSLASSFFSKGNDIMSPGESSGGYGKRTLFGPEGAIQLNDKDTVIAGTNLFDKGDDVMSAPQEIISVSNSTAPKRESTVDPNAGTNARLDKLISVTQMFKEVSHLRIQ